MFPINNNEAWALVVRNAGGTIYSHLFKTTDGGDNWDSTYSYTGGSMWNINFQNFSTGFSMGGCNFIVKTTNTGNNWYTIDTHSDLGYSININSMFLSSNSEIFSSGGNSGFSHVLKSTNSGLNWSVKSRNTDYNFSQITFVDNNTGFVISDSDSGKIFRTTNYGNNWDLSIGNSKYYFKKISFANSSTGCVIGSPYANANYNSKILRTTDSGDNWSEINNSLNISAFTIQFIDQQNGFIGCDSDRLLVTSNAGLNWNLVTLSHSIPFDIEGISFINNSTGWLSGHKTYSIYPNNFERNILWKTTNAGGNWNIIYDSIGFRRNYLIQFVTENTGFKTSNTGSKVYFKTINGGANWFSVSLPVYTDYWSFKFINQNTGWISGSTSTSNRVILKTTNGGNNWSFQLIEEYGSYIRSIYAFDENNAWFCGYTNSIYKTTDGGGVIGIEPINNTFPNHFSLSQNYPNPFNPTTIINYQLSVSSIVSLKIYDITGKEISVLVNQKQPPGYYNVKFDGSNLPSGVYFYKIFTEDFSETKKMILIK
ncbi:MAG: YCF48-related protein [Ignavibacteriae bacterium]|nr:YCF48-related protein [Ignavibacteriota bacterium]